MSGHVGDSLRGFERERGAHPILAITHDSSEILPLSWSPQAQSLCLQHLSQEGLGAPGTPAHPWLVKHTLQTYLRAWFLHSWYGLP